MKANHGGELRRNDATPREQTLSGQGPNTPRTPPDPIEPVVPETPPLPDPRDPDPYPRYEDVPPARPVDSGS
jgi:hypothetical protein